ncbi:MAG: hypothetical protein ACR2L5_00795 [Candidatus Actinomarinaceae bacterium]
MNDIGKERQKMVNTEKDILMAYYVEINDDNRLSEVVKSNLLTTLENMVDFVEDKN